MQNIPLEKAVIFGPVQSRRLGRSLGINLLPTATKCCSFNCIYCFFGPTPAGGTVESKMPTFSEITTGIDTAIEDIRSGRLSVDFITFAGNGEPTLHPEYPAVVNYLLKALRGLQNKIGTAIFTNGSRLGNPEVLSATALLDQAIVKIDIVDKERFKLINRPRGEVDIEEIAKSASKLPNLHIQTAVMKFNGRMYEETSLSYYCDLIKMASPHDVQLYNIIYPPAERGIETVTEDELAAVAEEVRRRSGIRAIVYDEVEITADEA